MKYKGFTLIELLAVIVLLGIILVIAVPQILKTIDSAKTGAFEDAAKLVIRAINNQMVSSTDFDMTAINENTISSILGLSNDNYQVVTVANIDSKPYVKILGKNKWKELVATGTYDDVEVTDTTNYVNLPALAAGMTPIKWNGSSWINTTVDDPSWYDYTNKIWANAKTADGSMWVWIPRYIYRISSGWHSATTGTIDVQFSYGTDDTREGTVTLDTGTTSNASNNKWTNHPAFTFGSTQLPGIWVAKFEATAFEGVANGYTSDGSCPIGGDNVTTKTIKSISNATSWRCNTIGNMFTSTRNMETNATYGWGTSGSGIDTHLMKNTEWGAVAYLSKSVYGQNTNEIWINTANNYTTGCSGTSAASGPTTGCTNTYDSANGVHASTTGNIYGIYDISGGTWEYEAAYLNNGNGNLGQGSTITGAASQYKDVYAVGGTDNQATNYGLTINQKGDALYETSNNINGLYSWFSDYSYMPSTSGPWFIRGAIFNDVSGAGAFAFSAHWGGTYSNVGFRPVLAVSSGL